MVINVKSLLQPHQHYPITQYKELCFHSLLRWKMIILPILTTSLIRFPFKGWENVLFLTWESCNIQVQWTVTMATIRTSYLASCWGGWMGFSDKKMTEDKKCGPDSEVPTIQHGGHKAWFHRTSLFLHFFPPSVLHLSGRQNTSELCGKSLKCPILVKHKVMGTPFAKWTQHLGNAFFFHCRQTDFPQSLARWVRNFVCNLVQLWAVYHISQG